MNSPIRKSLSTQLAVFHNVLNSGYSIVAASLDGEDWGASPNLLDDWIEANWQVLVANRVLEPPNTLCNYGVHPKHARFYSGPTSIPSHYIQTVHKGKTYAFRGWVTVRKDGIPGEGPPFDLVTLSSLDNKRLLRVSADEVTFRLGSLQDLGH